MGFGARGGSDCAAASEQASPRHLVTRLQELARPPKANESGSTCYEDFHATILLIEKCSEYLFQAALSVLNSSSLSRREALAALSGVPVSDLDGSLAQFVHDGICEGVQRDARLVDSRAAQVRVHMRRADFDDLDLLRLQLGVAGSECV